ncbi:FAD-binding oxidoreductase [Streptomyces sp. NBC_00335]|uniref:FAD-binding oxidoreductase n=1 Tax=unclassified Streptomyces TaxID=2593676 RepID=UPI00224FC58E|nr:MULTISPECIES: FAD-binding oxidoreductase [unclassified Streptomyces]MCX5408187.1 FAD-binding oxidoreductase [Streptomyces sp. NBC_00086]
MAPLSKAGTALAELREDLSGAVLVPEDPGYDEARTLYNGMIDRRPAVIAQCESPVDVVTAVRFARRLDLPIAVRGGGHSVAGMSLNDGGVVVDLRRMQTVTVHPGASAVRVEGGATMSQLDRACERYGLATTGGRVSTTGVGGFVLGGGTGWLDRKFGLAVDNLLAVDLVTADGEMVTATAEDHPELFWGLHGGGGNFGIATSLTLRLHELPDMSVAFLLYLPEHGPEMVRTYRDVMEDGPREAGGGAIYMTGPPEEFVPPHLVGLLLAGALITYAGPVEELRRLAAPLLAIPHEAELVTDLPYPDLQCMLDDPPGMRNYWSAEYLSGVPDEFVDVFCARADSMPVPSGTQHVVWPQGGAIAEGPADYPISFRDAPWAVHPFGAWEDPADDERVRQWVKDVRADVRPWSTGAVYLNFTGDEGGDRVAAGLGPENMRRLGRLKREYDPDNVFRFNHNIQPA